MKRVLFVTSSRIFPAHTGGHLRSSNFAESLSKLGFEVRVLSLAGRGADYRYRRKVLENVLSPSLVEVTDLRLVQGICQAVMNKLGYSRLWTLFWSLLGLSKISRSHLAWADSVIYDFPFIRPPKPFRNLPSFLLSHNVEADILCKGSWHQTQIGSKLVSMIERRSVNPYTKIFSCSDLFSE